MKHVLLTHFLTSLSILRAISFHLVYLYGTRHLKRLPFLAYAFLSTCFPNFHSKCFPKHMLTLAPVLRIRDILVRIRASV